MRVVFMQAQFVLFLRVSVFMYCMYLSKRHNLTAQQVALECSTDLELSGEWCLYLGRIVIMVRIRVHYYNTCCGAIWGISRVHKLWCEPRIVVRTT